MIRLVVTHSEVIIKVLWLFLFGKVFYFTKNDTDWRQLLSAYITKYYIIWIIYYITFLLILW